MLALFVVLAIAVVGGIAVLVARDRPLITDDPVGSRAMTWSPEEGIDPQDLAEVRFAVALRGYRMEEVDRVLDDTRAALEDRDALIADLQRVVAALGGPPAGTLAADPVSADAAGDAADLAADSGAAAPEAAAAAADSDTPARTSVART